MSCPPYTASTRTPRLPLYFWVASATCTASSRVGAITSACTAGSDGSMLCTSGRAKAAVFPVPVAARPITSFPASSRGMVRIWIGVGSS